jgi:hypothetical protein
MVFSREGNVGLRSPQLLPHAVQTIHPGSEKTFIKSSDPPPPSPQLRRIRAKRLPANSKERGCAIANRKRGCVIRKMRRKGKNCYNLFKCSYPITLHLAPSKFFITLAVFFSCLGRIELPYGGRKYTLF